MLWCPKDLDLFWGFIIALNPPSREAEIKQSRNCQVNLVTCFHVSSWSQLLKGRTHASHLFSWHLTHTHWVDIEWIVSRKIYKWIFQLKVGLKGRAIMRDIGDGLILCVGGLYSLGLSGLQVEATQRICCRVCLWIGTCARRQGKREALRQISSTSQVLGSWSWLLLKKKRLINKTRFRWCCQITETKGVFYGDNCPRSKLKIHLESSGLKPWWITVNYTWRL